MRVSVYDMMRTEFFLRKLHLLLRYSFVAKLSLPFLVVSLLTSRHQSLTSWLATLNRALLSLVWTDVPSRYEETRVRVFRLEIVEILGDLELSFEDTRCSNWRTTEKKALLSWMVARRSVYTLPSLYVYHQPLRQRGIVGQHIFDTFSDIRSIGHRTYHWVYV